MGRKKYLQKRTNTKRKYIQKGNTGKKAIYGEEIYTKKDTEIEHI